MHAVEILGLCAAACTSFATLPQLIKTWKTKSAKDVSVLLFMLSLAGTILWLIYGVMIDSISLIIANSISSTLSACILILVMKYKLEART